MSGRQSDVSLIRNELAEVDIFIMGYGFGLVYFVFVFNFVKIKDQVILWKVNEREKLLCFQIMKDLINIVRAFKGLQER